MPIISALPVARQLFLAEEEHPEGDSQKISNLNQKLRSAIQNDLDGLSLSGSIYVKTPHPMQRLDLNKLQNDYCAVYLSDGAIEGSHEANSAFLETNWRDIQNKQTGQIANRPGVFVRAEFLANEISVVEAAAIGREAALNIWHHLTTQA